jgi:two-component system, LytTR family, response regulator
MSERIRVVYADDEPIARRGLSRLLATEEDADVVAACENGIDALAAIRQYAPHVALLDIAMPGMSGVDVVRALGDGHRPAIVFVTAFDQFAIDAFNLHAVDYLLKPFDAPRFRVAFDRVRERLRARRAAESDTRLNAVLTALERRTVADRLSVKDGDRVILVPVPEILWCEAEDNYVRIHATTGRHLVRTTMRALEDRLDPRRFARIHRSYIVNLSRVREFRPLSNGEYQVMMTDGTRLVLSRTFRDVVLGRVQSKKTALHAQA